LAPRVRLVCVTPPPHTQCGCRRDAMDRNDLNHRLPKVVDSIVESVNAHPKLQHLNRVFLPNRDAIVYILQQLREVLYPGYFGKQGLTTENLPYRLGECVIELNDLLFDQVRCCLRYREQLPGDNTTDEPCEKCDAEAAQIVAAFFDRIPAIRELLAADVQAAFDGDPAAKTTDETIFCYPGLMAITVQRIAHELYNADVPLLPRIMTEYAHSLTGIDIHPGARLGRSFFIDHGTGVVIGETT
jgi:serine O-acetyltransferase